MSSAAADARFDQPIYSVTDAARHINVPRSTFDTWIKGYERKRSGGLRTMGAQIVTHIRPTSPRAPSVPWIGLAEGFVLAAFREAGLSMQSIREPLAKLRRQLGIEHVLASKSLYTDGAEVLYDYAESSADTPEGREARQLVVVRNNQQVFQEVVEDYLRRIEFSKDGYASLIHLPQYRSADVVVDPERSFGTPIFARGGNRVEVVLNRFKAGEPLDELTDEFGIPASELFDVVRVHLDTAA